MNKKMKRNITFISIGILVVVGLLFSSNISNLLTGSVTPQYNVNLIKNSGFENIIPETISSSTATYRPYNWEFVERNGNMPIISIEHYKYGDRSLKIKVDPKIITINTVSGYVKSNPIAIYGNSKYEFSVWGATWDQTGTRPIVKVVEADVSGLVMIDHTIQFDSGTVTWAQKKITFTTAPGSTTAYIIAEIPAPGGIGTLRIDEPSLELISTAATPAPTAQPTAQPTVQPTATPTPTPVVTQSPTPTPTPIVTVTVQPTASPTPTPVPDEPFKISRNMILIVAAILIMVYVLLTRK